MDFKKLIGHTVDINNRSIEINKIEKRFDNFGFIKYYINESGFGYSRFQVGMALRQIESKIKPSFFKRIFGGFGLFLGTPKYLSFDLEFGVSIGIRAYSYHKCGVYFFLRLFRRNLHLEFCWRDKDEYKFGNLPNEYGLRQLF